ncbi:MAG: sulfatase, partial [Bryobacteraceae bacterium]
MVVILADDLGYGDLSSYGAKDLRTPHIDRLVNAGVRFRHFYSNSPVCSPTRAALLTGRYPDRVGVPGVIRTHREENWGHLSAQAVLLPQPLAKAGYHTAIAGKWHLGLESPNTPLDRGFDTFRGFLGDMMDDYYTHRRHGRNYLRRDREVVEARGHATDLFTDWACEYLEERKKAGKPFFLYLAYNAPHAPIQPPAEWLDRVRKDRPELPEKRSRIAALIEHMDAGVGRVMESLEANGQSENTLVVLTSDNGGQLAVGGTCGGLRGGKEDMYEGGIRVPMCAVWPGRIRARTQSDRVALSMDLFPTVCEAAGARLPDGLDGVSLLADMEGRTGQLAARDLVWVRREGGVRYRGRDYYALRRGDWKLLQNTPFEPYQLFNLKDDPLEQSDRSQQEPKVYRELSAALTRHIQQAGAVPWQ